MIQIKRRSESKRGTTRFMLTICFYQDSRHEKPLFWIRDRLGIGYISRRNDGMTELRINGYKQVQGILIKLLPFLKFKKKQAGYILAAAKLLQAERSEKVARKIVNAILLVQAENYVTRKKRTRGELLKALDLTP